ncbi:ABC transporter substrate-binding protein [Paenibacillus sp. OAS669]|uniref:ABC transporter substrate-binding protein n=1 Tax=Paenibacillus sp. OAS669 TaxID=2663821 RepID=UPI00178913FC|nr:extracellular solute-binding protein [Paenibacillus sp. OAS669]MBE1445292.1 multiple sugar transport system substrate-binding protein [Paenibacillus sp. OAS669]
MVKVYGKAVIGAASLLLFSNVMLGCSNDKEVILNTEGNTGKPKEPITLTIFNGQPGALNFESLGITEAIKKKFPHITLNIILRDPKSTDYKDLIAGGTLPDIIYESASFTVDRIIQNGFQYDLQELVKKNNFNLQQFEPNVLAQTQNANGEGKLYGLPFTMNRYALFYNKDIFDKLGVAYPKDGMTWDEVYDLAKKVTRVEQGTTYMGFAAIPNNMMLNNQLSLSPLDPREDKAVLNTDGWKLMFDNLKRFYEIPDNALVPTSETAKGSIAMALESHPLMIGWVKANPNINWDVVSLPVLKEKPGTGLKPATLALFISQTSKYKDEAFQIVSYLVSEQVQTMLSKQGVGTPLVNANVKNAFGQEVQELQGKNTGAFYYYKDAPPSPLRAADLTNVNVDFGKPFGDMVKNKADTNTVLRQFEEAINQAIATAKSDKAKK